MAKAQPHTATERLAQLREQEQKAKAASNQAEREALLARNAAEQAEQEVVRAHAGHGSLDAAEQALADAEATARTAGHKAQGAALHHQERQAELRQYHGAHYSDLIAEAEEGAARPCELMLEGVKMIVKGDALWKAQAQEIDGHLKAAGQQPRENMRDSHELAEIARVLSKFSGVVSPPLPHGRGITIRAREQETAEKLKRERQAA
jgi:hypothetical protein